MRKILIFYVRAGEGHRKVAEAVYEGFGKKNKGRFSVEIHDALNFSWTLFGRGYPFVYYHLVTRFRWVWGFFYRLLDFRWMHPVVSFFRSGAHYFVGRDLVRYLCHSDPCVIVNTHFFPAEVSARLKRTGRIRGQVVTVLTDYAPHNFWINHGTDLYIVMSETTKLDLVKRGVSPQRIFPLGIPVAERFHPVGEGEKQGLRKKLGLAIDPFTVLFTSGSFGMPSAQRYLDGLVELGAKIQILVVSGRNELLKASLEKLNYSFPLRVYGFIENMDELMKASDLLVARSSGSTTSESLAVGRPLVVTGAIEGQETENAAFLRRHGASFEVNHPHEFEALLRSLLEDPSRLEEKRLKVAEIARPEATQTLVSMILEQYL